MTQELGFREFPPTNDSGGNRKLLLVLLLSFPTTQEEDGAAIMNRYWEQTRSQMPSLETWLGPVKHVYHEGVVEGGEEGLKGLESAESPSFDLVREKCRAGAVLEATEDEDMLREAVDLQRRLMIPFISEKAAMQVRELFDDSVRRRHEHIRGRIDETLGQDEVGLLVITPQQDTKIPADVGVFLLTPPSLDPLHRWMDDWVARKISERESQSS